MGGTITHLLNVSLECMGHTVYQHAILIDRSVSFIVTHLKKGWVIM